MLYDLLLGWEVDVDQGVGHDTPDDDSDADDDYDALRGIGYGLRDRPRLLDGQGRELVVKVEHQATQDAHAEEFRGRHEGRPEFTKLVSFLDESNGKGEDR